jgi:flagellar hook-length control protein FliK
MTPEALLTDARFDSPEAARSGPPTGRSDQTLPTDGTTLPPGQELEVLMHALALPAAPTPPSSALAISAQPHESLDGATPPEATATGPGPKRQAPGSATFPVADFLMNPVATSAVTTLTTTDTEQPSGAPSPADRPVDVDLFSTLAAAARAEPPASSSNTRSPVSFDSLLPAAANVNLTAPVTDLRTTAATPPPLDVLPVLQPLADTEAWSQNLGDRLLMLADNGLQSARLKLHPEHLGPLEIRIAVDDDGGTQVWFSAHHAQTRDALENAIPRLRELFADQGLNLAHANVDSGRGAFAQRDFTLPTSTGQDWAHDDAEAPGAAAATVWQLARPSERRVDVFV